MNFKLKILAAISFLLIGALAHAASQEILFTSNEAGKAQLFSVKPNGTQKTQLTFLPGGAAFGKWSPDKSKILFSSQTNTPRPHVEIFLMNADGSHVHQLTFNGEFSSQGSWLDEQTIIYGTELGGPGRMHRIKADGSGDTVLGPTDMQAHNPQANPAGSRIAFEGIHAPVLTRTLFIMRANGSGAERLEGSFLEALAPDWSADGERLAFEVVKDSNLHDIFVADAEGHERRNLTHGPGSRVSPIWAPHGRHLAFSRIIGTACQIRILDEDDGSESKLVLSGPGYFYPTDWK